MHTCWFAFPGGRSDVRLNVPVGDLLFALVPAGLCCRFLGQCVQTSSSRNGSKLEFFDICQKQRSSLPYYLEKINNSGKHLADSAFVLLSSSPHLL